MYIDEYFPAKEDINPNVERETRMDKPKECNIDLLVAGCSTTCLHCYVDGGPAPWMDLGDVEYLFSRLHTINALLQEEPISFSVTLDNEPANHPEALAVFRLAEQYLSSFYYHHGSTTGIPYVQRRERDKLLDFIFDAGWREVSFALHGAEKNHNLMVRHPRALEHLLEAARLFHAHGFRVGTSLMLSKSLIQDQMQMKRILSDIEPDFRMLVIPLHAPNQRMKEYLKLRPTLKESMDILSMVSRWGMDADAVYSQLKSFHLHGVMESMAETPFDSFPWPRSHEVAYYSVRPNLDLYDGNTGDERRKIGNLKDLSDYELVEIIKSSKANETFSDMRYSDDERKVIYEHVQQKSLSCPDWVFPDLDSAICCLADVILQD